MTYPKGFTQLEILKYVIIYSYSIGIPYILFSDFIEKKIEIRLRWLEKPVKRFFVTIAFKTGFAFVLVLLIHYFFFFRIRGENLTDIYEKTLNAFFYAVFFVGLSIFTSNTIVFLKNWKQAAVNEEKLKREILNVEFEALKNQVNPHFLFNNLTALSSLLYKDQDKAVRFINQLSEIYRYVLEYGKNEVVSLETEKKLLNNFIYLYGIRYENGLKININIPEERNKFIVPMSLQILLENAIKHNTLSEEQPLEIKITLEDNYISVWNNFQPKTSVQHSGKLGLNNIKSRYRYLTNKEVIIEKTNEHFKVKVPVLNKKP
ncbi:MAG: histidine kinase [Prolixibacteraceae bacterium]|nr:histidine kinase [Prolixibacteraceae bacterium]